MSSTQKPPHDGMLNSNDHCNSVQVEHSTCYSVPAACELATVSIRGGYNDNWANVVHLDAAQALSLLAWLYQEQETLEVLAKGQSIEVVETKE